MADIFFTEEARRLLENKYIIMLGDSNTRAIYKDLITLLTQNTLINQAALRRKQETSYCGDVLGNHSELFRGREYCEERSFTKFNVKVEFIFLNRCITPRIIDLMEDIHLGLHNAPDVVYINSTLWDMSRWGPNGPTEFKDNLNKLARLFKSSLPESTLVVWATAIPVSKDVQSSILLKQTRVLQNILRFDVMEANSFARQVMAANNFDVIDLHFHMRMQIHRRIHDGVHYLPKSVRLLTNLVLTHFALSWDFPLPNRVQTILLDKAKAEGAVKVDSPTQQQLETQQQLKTLQKMAQKPTKNEKKKAARKRNQEKKPNLREALFSKQKPTKRQGKKKRGYNGGCDQRDNPYRVKANVITPWASGKEQNCDLLPPPVFSQGINFSDEAWLGNTFSQESRPQNKSDPVSKFQECARAFDEQFQNARYDDSRFQNDVFEPRGHNGTFFDERLHEQSMLANSRYRPEPFQNRFQDQRYPMESGYENNIPQFGRNPRRFENDYYEPPEPPNRRQLLSTMVRSSRYAPY